MKKLFVSLLLICALLLCACSAYTSASTEEPDPLSPSASETESPSPASSNTEEPVTPNYAKFKDFPLTEDGMIDFEYINSPREDRGLVCFEIKFICTANADEELFSSVGGVDITKHLRLVDDGKEATIAFTNHNIYGHAMNQEELEKLSADDRIVEIVYMGDLIASEK